MDTVFAVSSGSPPAGIAVVRVSGPGVPEAIEALCGGLTTPRLATLRVIGVGSPESEIDRGLVMFFPGPHSFTGEDVVEFHIHGGRATVAKLLRVLGEFAGFRPAEQGEFTRRAFNNGRLDLTQAEGIADLVAADTEDQRQLALQQSQGSIRTQYESWAELLLRARGLLEAEIDFAEEESLGGVWAKEGRVAAAAVLNEMEKSIAGHDNARSIRGGLEVLLLGPVNAGKSTMLNALAGRDIAIVSPEPGTTRDLIEVPVDLGGHKVTFIDSAGIRHAQGSAEYEGIRRARSRAPLADLVLWLNDGAPDELPDDFETPVWSVATKTDRVGDPTTIRFRKDADFRLSAMTGDGIPVLLSALEDWASHRTRGLGPALLSRERHRVAIVEAADAVRAALDNREPDLAAEHLRHAGSALGRLSGRVEADDVLDIVFREFCIGK